MLNECSECGAGLAPNVTVCSYCGSTNRDENEQLLKELMDIKRQLELAQVSNNKLVMKNVLADEYVHSESDAGSVFEMGKADFLGREEGNDNFISYAISNEELLDRTSDTATISCHETITRKVPDEPYFWRTKSYFVFRDGRWQILSEYKVTIDENGKDYE